MATAYMIDDVVDAVSYNLLGLATLTLTNLTAGDGDKLYSKRVSDVLIATAKTGIQLDIDFGAAKNINTIALLGLAVTSAASITVLGDDNPGFTTPDVNESRTGAQFGQRILILDQTYNLRYWRVTISDATNPYFPWIGEIIMGVRIEFTHPHSWGHVEQFNYKNVTLTTDYGVRWNYRQASQRNLSKLVFNQRPDAEAEQIETLIEGAHGSHLPVLMIPDTVDEPDRAVYGHLMDQIGREFDFIEWNNFSEMQVIEQPRAQVIRVQP